MRTDFFFYAHLNTGGVCSRARWNVEGGREGDGRNAKHTLQACVYSTVQMILFTLPPLSLPSLHTKKAVFNVTQGR